MSVQYTYVYVVLKDRSADQIKIDSNQKIDYFNQAQNTTHVSSLAKAHNLNIGMQHLILILYLSQLSFFLLFSFLLKMQYQNDMRNRFYNSVAA